MLDVSRHISDIQFYFEIDQICALFESRVNFRFFCQKSMISSNFIFAPELAELRFTARTLLQEILPSHCFKIKYLQDKVSVQSKN